MITLLLQYNKSSFSAIYVVILKPWSSVYCGKLAVIAMLVVTPSDGSKQNSRCRSRLEGTVANGSRSGLRRAAVMIP